MAECCGASRHPICGVSGKGFPESGLRLLEWAGRAGGLAPGQGALVTTARGGLRLAWKAMMRELAPQDPSGAYVRPSYGFKAVTLDADAADGAYHLYHGNACPW